MPNSLGDDVWRLFSNGNDAGTDFSIVAYNSGVRTVSPNFSLKVVDAAGSVSDYIDGKVFEAARAQAVDSLRLDWTPAGQAAFFAPKWAGLLRRSSVEVNRNRRKVREGRPFYIEVILVFLDWSREPEKYTVRFSSLQEISHQLSDKSGIASSRMLATAVGKDSIFRQVSTQHDISEQIQEGDWLIFYELAKPERGRTPTYLPANLFNSESGQHFGIPLLIETPRGRSTFESLCGTLKLHLNRYGRSLPMCEKWLGLDNWWKSTTGDADRGNPGPGTSGGERSEVAFPVHKFILRARSEVFKAMLDDKAVSDRFVMDGVHPKVLEEFVRFLYTDEIGRFVIELAVLADKYRVNGLKSKAEKSLVSSPGFIHCLKLLAFAHHFEMQTLMAKCLETVVREFRRVIKLPEWGTFVRTHPDLMVTICEMVADFSVVDLA